MPTRLDRLIAFLDSYFGQVELVTPDQILAERKEQFAAQKLEDASPDNTETSSIKDEVEDKLMAPVIRVRLDEHVADVTIEDLVSLGWNTLL